MRVYIAHNGKSVERDSFFEKQKRDTPWSLGFRTLNIFVNNFLSLTIFNELHSLLRASNSGPLLYSGHVFLFHLLVGG